MRYHLLIFLLIPFLTVTIAYCGDDVRTVGPIAQNRSLITITPPGRTAADVSQCLGLSHYRNSISDIGLSESDLAKDVNCIAADFDSNGYLDFVIWGSLIPNDLRGTRSFKVLFFRGSKIIHSETIRRENYDHAVIWPHGSGSDGECEVKPQTVDGVMLPGEGGGTWFYVYEPKSKQLKGQIVCDE